MTTLEAETTFTSEVQIKLPAALRVVLSANLGPSKVAQRHGLAITDAMVYGIARAFNATF